MSDKNIQISLPANEWRLVASLLQMAHDDFHEHGCNDLPGPLLDLLAADKWHEIAQEIQWPLDAGDWMPGDDSMMGHYAELIENTVEAEDD